jgi:hypothetical protein
MIHDSLFLLVVPQFQQNSHFRILKLILSVLIPHQHNRIPIECSEIQTAPLTNVYKTFFDNNRVGISSNAPLVFLFGSAAALTAPLVPTSTASWREAVNGVSTTTLMQRRSGTTRRYACVEARSNSFHLMILEL